MEKTFNDVQDEYSRFKNLNPATGLDLTSFAKAMDEQDGVPLRQQAYTAPWYKKADAAIDRAFEFTHLPELTGGLGEFLGGGIDSVLGTHVGPTIAGIGRDTPRMIAESLLTVPEVASGVGAPAAIATWLNRGRKIAGYGGAALKGYAQTDSPVGAAIGAGSMYGANKLLLPAEMGGMNVGGRATRAVTDVLAPEVGDATTTVQRVLGPLVGFGTDVGAITGLNEATRQAELSVGPNAVGLTDPARNPLTQENIAGNVAGAAFFTPQLYHGLKNPQRLQTGVHEALADPIIARDSAEKAILDTAMSAPTETQGELPAADPELRSRQEAVYGTLKSNLDAAALFDRDGNTEQANLAREAAARALNEAGSGRFSPPSPEMLGKLRETVDNEARMSTDARPEWLQKFTAEVKEIIDTLNEGRVNYEEQAAQNRETMSPKGFAAWDAQQQKVKGESWHPGARDPAVVDRVWSNGKLQPLTPEWLSAEFNATVDQGGNPQFATRVVAQKVANYMADRLPQAVEADVAARKAVTETSKGVQKVDALDTEFIKAINQLPPQFQRAIINRTLEIKQNSNFSPSQAERLGVSEGVRYRAGRPQTPYPNWQRAVIDAVYGEPKYGPQGERLNFTKLIAKDVSGNYTWEPAETHLPMAAGGKTKTGGAVEQNIEALATQGAQESVGAPDEEAVKAAFAEGGTGEYLARTTSDALTPAEDVTPADVKLGLKAGESSTGEQVVEKRVAKQRDVILKNMSSLTDDQLWSLARDQFGLRGANEAAKKAGIRKALTDVLSGRFYDARRFFQFDKPVEGERVGQKIGEGAHVDRAARVLAKLADPKAVERARTQMKASEDQQQKPLVQYAAPVRLRRWLEAKGGGGYNPDSQGGLASKSVPGLLKKLSVGNDEMALYKAAGIDKLLEGPRVKVGDLAKWMEENTPKVEVKKLQPFTEVSSKVAEAQHYLEGQGFRITGARDILPPASYGDEPIMRAGGDTLRLYGDRANDAISTIFSEPQNAFEAQGDAATGRYGVEPKDLKNMPGAVDILVRVPMTDTPKQYRPDKPYGASLAEVTDSNRARGELYRGLHFGESDRNVLASVRGYMETLPSGEKVFHVFEVQSDWGQTKAKDKAEPSRTYGNKVPDHPLLAVYEQLALKAAVEHAREIGAKYVAISDAETAMMTEGHDRYLRVDDDIRMDPNATEAEKTPKITQEPGMRAAYDVRLPQTMEKLGGKFAGVTDFGEHKVAGQPDFAGENAAIQGSPVFKNVQGGPKTQVTARLYDVSGVPDKFAAFGYAKPSVDATVDPGSPGTLANQPKPGQFTEDASRTLKVRINDVLGREGYSGSTRDFLTEIAVALSRQMDLSNVDFYRLQGHPEGMVTSPLERTGGRANLGINVDKVREESGRTQTVKLLQTLQHEITHMDGYIKDGLLAKPDAYSDERKRVYDNMRHLADNLNEDERAAMLSQIREYVPKEMQSTLRQADGRPYGTSNPEEFVSEITGHVVNMLFFDTARGHSAAQEMLDYAPQEFREFARNTFKTTADIMQSMRDAADVEGEGRALTGKTDPFILSEGFDALIRSANVMTELRYVDKALADARTFMAQADGAPQPGMTNAMWFTAQNTPYKAQLTMPKETSATSMDAFKMAADYIGPHAADKASRPNLIMRWLAPFRNELWAMEKDGNRMARSVADAIFGLEGGANRLSSNILSDFMKRNPDGSMKYDQDNALIQRIQKEPAGRWRDEGLNKVRAWQQEVHELADGTKLDAQQMFVQDPKTGQVTVNTNVKGAQAAWDRMRTQLSRADQELVMNASVALDRVGQRSKDVLMAQLKESNVNKAAVLIQAVNRQMPTEQALQVANAAHDAFISGNVLSLQGTLPPEQIGMLQSLFTGADGKSGLIGNLMKVGEHFDNRPGYSSEQLPWDWIVRYRTKDDEVKFQSFKEETQAKAGVVRLVNAGNRIDGEVVNRRDVNSLTKIDDPGDILTKLSEQENFVWDKFVQDMETKMGTDVGQALRAGYTPLERAVGQQAAQGIGKFLKERKGFVDRSSFDYLDAAITSSQRLAYSVAVKSMKERVDLLLNDPSVRMRASFRELVSGHVQEMLRPQSESLKEVKGIVSGYYIGANLGSAVTNAMQSLQTLVPILDSKNKTGTFVKPWKQFGEAIKDATDMTLTSDWQKDAVTAKRKDPSQWTEDETVAALWARQNESGGFSHTVVDDLVYGTDQRLLANAKFGRGDYGPVTKTSMIRSGAYLLNQFAMKPFRWVEHGNAKVAFLAGVRQAYEQGLRGDAAYSHANQVQGLATFGGGRANASGLQTTLSKGFTPGGAGLALALQQYGFGVVAMHAQFVKDAIGRSDMSPSEKFHARRVYGSMLMTQIALAGTLGLPLVGATLTALEKVFGVPANQTVRSGLASLSEGPDGEPDETGQMIAEVGLNGFLDYYTGLDASSRLGTTSLLGTSSYRGFNWGDLAGPVGGILENGVKAMNYFATGNPLQAASALAPQALKNAILQTDMQRKYGDSGFRDTAGNLLYTPTPTESTLYKFGVRPRELSRKRQAATAIQTSNELTGLAQDRELDGASESLIAGDGSRTMRLAMDRMTADPTQNYKDVLRQVMDRAVGSTVEKDLLATGSKLNEAERSHIVKTFGADVNNRRSEVDLQKLRMQMATLLGDPSVAPNESAFKQAAMIDALVQSQGMPRSQAVRLVQFLHLD